MTLSKIQSRRDSATNWTAANPILAQAEKGYELETIGTSSAKYKIGDGVTTWNDLPYQSAVGGVQTVTGVNVDNADPLNPVIEATTKTDLGLENVDNTSDLSKPISTSTQTALDLKADKATLIQSGGNVTGSIDTDANTFSLTSSGGGTGGDITEDGTNLKFGTGSDFGTGSNRYAGGILAKALGNNAYASGYNVEALQDSFAIGANINAASGTSTAYIAVGNDLIDIEKQSIVITSDSTQSSLGKRTKSIASIIIGGRNNINSDLPDNTSVNKGVYVGNSITCVGNLGASNTALGTNIDVGDAYKAVVIGKNIDMSGTNHTEIVAIGNNLDVNNGNSGNSVVIGSNSGAGITPITGVDGGQAVSIGAYAYAGSWRNTVLGAYARGENVSSTVIGYGAYSGLSHGQVFGRGAYLNKDLVGTEGITLLKNTITVLGNAYAKYTNPYVQNSDEVVNHVSEQNAGTRIIRLTVDSGLDADIVPTVTDTKGAILELSGGISTGTAQGGLLTFASSPASGVSSNVLNSNVVAAQIDASAGVDTRFMLLDVTDGTLKRVQFGADDSAGTGFKVLKVEN